jgi:peptide/nickel transport system substrate-binding protein
MSESSVKEKKMMKSMKDAFQSVRPSKNIINVNQKRKRISVREWLWNYPSNISKLFRDAAPFSFILIFSIVGLTLFFFLTSSTFANVITKEKEKIFVEGSVGAISSFNPIFTSQSNVDSDIRELVFEKFISISQDGTPQKEIASQWEISSDGKTYDFTISLDHKWQDGEPLTIDDVLFTFDIAKELASKYKYDTIGSPLTSVEISKLDDRRIRFVLTESNSTFFEAVSAYIIPKHRFEGINVMDIPFDSFAKFPLGSGPYQVYRSEPNVVYLKSSEYYPTKPVIDTFIYRLYSNNEALEAAFRNGILDAMGSVDEFSISFSKEYSGFNEYSFILNSRLRMIFFNTRKERLENKDVRIALNYITNKQLLMEKANISGEIAYGPIPSTSWAYSEKDIFKYEYQPEKALEIFNKLGYTKSENDGYFQTGDKKILSFTLSYLDNSLNNRIASALKLLWKDEGVVLNLEPLSYTQLTQEILATRDFELLMYEVETTIDPDQYNLWHSLKTNYPDLNLSGYTYERVDILLEEARQSQRIEKRKSNYALFQKYITQDTPVIFLYHPQYTYIVKDNVTISDISGIMYPYQRFSNVYTWTK